MATYEQIIAKSKELAAAGDMAGAKRLAQIALSRRATAAPATPNPDGTYGAPPPGFVLNPRTGQMEDMTSPNNPNIGGGQGLAAAQGAGQGVTFGAMDEVVGGLYGMSGPGTFGQNYDYATAKMREELDRSRQNFPVTTTGAEIAGAMSVPVGGAMASTGTLPVRMAKSAGMTGALSALYGAFTGQGGLSDRASSAMTQGAVGAGVGALIPVAGSALQALLNSRAANKAIKAAAQNAPSTDELKALGRGLYDQVDAAGVQISPQAFDRARGTILGDLQANTGFDDLPGPGSLTPGTARVMQIMDASAADMATNPTAALPFKSLDKMRRQAGAAAGNVMVPADRQAGMTVIEGLDDFVENLAPGDIVAGDIAALNSALPKARDVWSRMSKSQAIDDAMVAGGDYLSGASSGIRNQFKNILRNPKRAARFTEAERAAMRKVVNGSIPEQLLQLAGGGLGQMATAIGGGAMGGLPGFLAGTAIAAGTRKAAEAVTTRKAETLRGLVANGGLGALPKAPTALRDLMEQRLRLGTAAAIQPR